MSLPLYSSVQHVKKQVLSSSITGWLVGTVVGLGVELTAAAPSVGYLILGSSGVVS